MEKLEESDIPPVECRFRFFAKDGSLVELWG